MASMSGRGFSKKRTKRGKSGPEAIASVLLRSTGSESREGAPLPPRAWHDAVGDRIARRTRPMRIDRKILTVRAATSVWAQELTFVAPSILARLNALGFEIEGLRFRVGPVEVLDEPIRPKAVKSVPSARPLPRDLARQIEHVGDVKLREAIGRAAAANLAWQEARATSTPRAGPGPRSAAREIDQPVRTPTSDRGVGRRKS